MNDFLTFAFVAQTTALVIASLLILYPVIAYAHNVAHTRGLLLLSAGFLTLTVSYIVSVVFDMGVESAVLDLAAALLAAAGTWEFARPFVRFGDTEFEAPTTDETSGGFESARDD